MSGETLHFPRPGLETLPAGAMHWHQMYPYSLVFGEQSRQEYEDNRFWFQDAVHYPGVVAPFDATVLHFAQLACAQYNSRHFLIPTALGIDFRIHNGYVYMSPLSVDDPDEIARRSIGFGRRAGTYYEEWDERYLRWRNRVSGIIARIAALDFSPLPSEEPEKIVLDGDGSGSSYRLISAYHQLLDLLLLLWQHHFEMLAIGYAAYLDFFEHCRRLFAGITDIEIIQMVSGIDVDLYRPDAELRRLAQLAVDKGVVQLLDPDDPQGSFERLRRTSDGRAWFRGWCHSQDPWFEFHSGTGFAHTDPCWATHPEIPLGFIKGYAESAVDQQIERRDPLRFAAEQSEIVARYGTMLVGAERETFLAGQRLAAKVFHYVENHNFYVEHRGHAAFWRQVRRIGAILADAGFLRVAEDIFMLNRHEVDEALLDVCTAWAVGAPAAGRGYWQPLTQRRRATLDALGSQPPQPAFGVAPASVTEPFTVMLFGIDDAKIRSWSAKSDDATAKPRLADHGTKVLIGLGVSPGLAEGPVKVVRSQADLSSVSAGDVLVARTIVPAWAPVLARVAAVLTDAGGVMSHGAILCREYGVPAVASLGTATTSLRPASRVTVDGNAGRVTLLSEPG
ncbi:MAG TPA: PEP-utilizing enzyme [Streptosporangiaceae bacterium]|nr:PEP-utilizing enzyme [Streptosporangiaceae bacterium]